MTMQQSIEAAIQKALAPTYLSVANESHMHNVPPGSESHFNLVVVSDAFVGRRKVARHQQVYQLVSAQLAGGVHALALHTYTPEEWAARSEPAPASPDCMGGGQ
jgi:BolA protein